ncbi:Ni/Fe-hydrogenase, b-type cytochrome subunit [Azohydromonas sediminis]|uniref:Ni/Fe-hydrogenase, b-type cytochrome subunit n=1 Tax=Azohydromonas sediminis TaxID=2259674 RepID=UPI000E65AB68|nr:Ni/Fe-hydrogenase, b-type cytochrome subunit [Azohydromonas sediminis]
MNTATHGQLFPVYVWQVPVRIWHWGMALAMVVLAVTGYLIGSPPPSVGGEASDHFWFGYIRFAHFAAGYVFAILFALRVLWVFVGNRFAREIFLVSLHMLKPSWWSGLIDQTKYYLFLKSKARAWQGHNPLAMAAMFFMYVLGTVFMIVTGFALYGEGTGMDSWAHQYFSSWVLPLLGYSMNVHTLHHLGMWYLLVFTIVHLYMVVREDICSGETVISTMVNGWRVEK